MKSVPPIKPPPGHADDSWPVALLSGRSGRHLDQFHPHDPQSRYRSEGETTEPACADPQIGRRTRLEGNMHS